MEFVAIIDPINPDHDAFAYRIAAANPDEAYHAIRKELPLDEIAVIPADEATGDITDLPLWVA